MISFAAVWTKFHRRAQARGSHHEHGWAGPAFDNIFVERLWRNVKHEDVYLNGYDTMGELLIGLTKYFAVYNGERPHQALGNQTPDAVYTSASGGGAMTVDKLGAKQELSRLPIALRCTATALGEVRIENGSAMQNAKTWAAPFSCVKSGAT